MPTITCPGCGEELSGEYENCPICGAPIGVLEGGEGSAAVNNASAIDAMLKSASLLIDESENLGLPPDEEEEQKEDEEPESFKKAPPQLSEEQKTKINSGSVVTLTPDEPDLTKHKPKTPRSKTEKKPPKPDKPGDKEKEKSKGKEKSKDKPTEADAPPEQPQGPILEEVDENGEIVTAPEANAEPPKQKKPRSSASTIIAAAAALVIGAAAGFFAKSFLFSDLPKPDCQDFALRAVKGVDSVLEQRGEDLYIADAYVSEGAASRQCVFKAFTESEDGSAALCWFRVKSDVSDEQTLNIYFELDEARYEVLKNSADEEDRVTAAMLMNNQKELERCVSEIESGQGNWQSANSALLNNELHPYSKAEGAAEG